MEENTLTHSASFSLADYLTLLKPRVMSLVIFTGIAGWLVSPASVHPFIGLVALFCLSIGAGAAGALNMVLEKDVDARMLRTADRPLPKGRLTETEALTFSTLLALFAVFNMGLVVNWIAAGLLAFSIFFYVVIYTLWLKPRTSLNIVIGGLAGAMPPVIMDAAISGTVHPPSIFLTALVFLWTPPHFWALSISLKDDYKTANIPMLPVVKGETNTYKQIFVYTLILGVFSVVAVPLNIFGPIYGVTAAALGVLYVLFNLKLLTSPSRRMSLLSFGFSIFYLFALFTAVIAEKIL